MTQLRPGNLQVSTNKVLTSPKECEQSIKQSAETEFLQSLPLTHIPFNLL
ncbi:MAG: hypothetical protein JKX98_10080 [Alcanivoracaceae bacterium]|nr:hypothetical protein [Alcanivoracaceae bacterium]